MSMGHRPRSFQPSLDGYRDDSVGEITIIDIILIFSLTFIYLDESLGGIGVVDLVE